jgi:hypothetical protein
MSKLRFNHYLKKITYSLIRNSTKYIDEGTNKLFQNQKSKSNQNPNITTPLCVLSSPNTSAPPIPITPHMPLGFDAIGSNV